MADCQPTISAPDKAPLTAIVQTFNMENTVAECLQSLTWVDDLLVVDDFSTDATLQVCQTHGARVLEHKRENAAAQKNWAIPQAHHEWVLVVDADERVTPALRQRIEEIVRSPADHFTCYRIQRWNWYFGRLIRHCGWDKDRPVRLFRRTARYEDKHVHADVIVDNPRRLGFLSEAIIHTPYRSYDLYFQTLNKYSTWGAEDLHRKGVQASLMRIAGRPIWRFFRQYLLKRGFLDGRQGLMLCLWAAASVLAKYCKLWELQHPGCGEPEEAPDLDDRL